MVGTVGQCVMPFPLFWFCFYDVRFGTAVSVSSHSKCKWLSSHQHDQKRLGKDMASNTSKVCNNLRRYLRYLLPFKLQVLYSSLRMTGTILSTHVGTVYAGTCRFALP